MGKVLYKKKKEKDYPLVSIITVNYDHPEVTCDLIDSLNKITYPNIEIIVVDNNSPNDDPGIIKHRFPNIVFVQNPINYGFAAGNNFGIMRAKGKYVMLLNNDTVVSKDFLEPLIEKLEKNPDIGAVSPKIRFFHTPDTLQYAGYTPINYYTMRNFAVGYREVDKGQHDRDSETAYGHGAAIVVPMDVIKKIGLMSYIFFLYYEEADWCARIKKAGYRIFYVHNSLVYHKESISTGKLSPMKIYYLNRNRLVFMRRNISGKKFYIGIIYQLFVAIPKNAFKFLIKGKIKLFHAYYRAIGWHLKNTFSHEIHENPML
ncbi:MAG: glycosyltransferase family 2 protein [Bacteroidales bacterium]|nr:glycosyltransferase family 2 protein [Bacteroidales bacterium]MCF8343871.1 glycosyltransferase family 2 protein [Bacteroidales bacterium]MCF8351883.1 glycosyltransferase family 2 protein [Bacteroidales bacterium]MCF8375256.1 glycosyltransferase family 2 protein [Bacteroidales bacterium]MCF8400280.1 glycosyltransferase family 2 protein [Bacteroidales bacterium]